MGQGTLHGSYALAFFGRQRRQGGRDMATWKPDPTFYPSPRMAMKAPAETLAYVAAFDPRRQVPDGIAVVDVDPKSSTYSKIVNTVAMPKAGDELHHFGWNACSSCLCPNAPHPHVERRYLVVPGLRSSRFDIRGRWEIDRGEQELAYDAWWHLGHDTLVTSEWGTPDTFEEGLVPDILLGAKYGRRLHFWDLHTRKHQQTIDFGDKYQLVFELRPAHDPTKAYGFVNCVLSLADLSSSIWVWHRDGAKWAVTKIIDVPAEPAEPDQLPPMLKGFKAVAPVVTGIDLSTDGK